MIKIILFILILFSAPVVYAQDTLYIKGQLPVAAKITEVSEDAVRYKKFTNPDGPVYVIRKKSIFRIVYQNGEIDSLSNKVLTVPVMKVKNAQPFKWAKGKFTASVLVTDFLFEMATINVERTFLNDHLSISVPLSIGFNYEGKDTNIINYDSDFFGFRALKRGHYNEMKTFSTGINFLAYPFKEGEVNYFAGVSFGFGQFNYWVEWVSNYPTPKLNYKKFVQDYYSIMIKNGIKLNPSRHLSIFLNLAMGVNKSEFTSYDQGYINQHTPSEITRTMEASVSIGYTF